MSESAPTYHVWTEEDGTWAEADQLFDLSPLATFRVRIEPDGTWTESEGRFSIPPLNPNQPVPVILTADEWAAISVASRSYSYAAGVDAETGLEHKRVRPLLAELLERKP